MQLNREDFLYLALCLEGLFFGLYSGLFVLHLQYHASKKGSNVAKQNIVFHALSVLYLSSVAVITLDIAFIVALFFVQNDDIKLAYRIENAQPIFFGFCDFIAQSILIHRCWIVWGRNIRVVIIPSILAFTYLVIWIATIGGDFIGQDGLDATVWGNSLALTGLTTSMIVNASVTGLLVFRIFRVFRKVKGNTTSDEIFLGVTHGRKLRTVIFVIIESAMTLFIIQLARVTIAANGFVKSTGAEDDAYLLIIGIHEMFNGITPTIILIRVSMGLSFHDEPSLVETVSSLEFRADNPNAIPGAGSISQNGSLDIGPDDLNAISETLAINQGRRDDDIGGGDDIQMVDR